MLRHILLSTMALASTATAIVITAPAYTLTTTITEDGTTRTEVLSATKAYTTSIHIPTTSPYAAPSGAAIVAVAAARDVYTTYAIAPSINPIARPSAHETLIAGQDYTVKWKPTTDENQQINLMLYRGNATDPESVWEPIQLIGGIEMDRNETGGTFKVWRPLPNDGEATFKLYDNIISADNYVILSNGASGVNRSPFFTIRNPDPQYAHDPVPGSGNTGKKQLSTGQVAGIIAGVGGFIVFMTLSVFVFCLARRNGWFVKKFKAEVETYKNDLGYNDWKGKGKANNNNVANHYPDSSSSN